MQAKLGGGLIEKRSIDYVPHRGAARQGVASVAGVVLGRCASGDRGHRASSASRSAAISCGWRSRWCSARAFGTFFMAFHSTQGPQLGLPQMIQSRPQFGYLGALLVWGVALFAFIGFNAFNQMLAAQTAAFPRRRAIGRRRC